MTGNKDRGITVSARRSVPTIGRQPAGYRDDTGRVPTEVNFPVSAERSPYDRGVALVAEGRAAEALSLLKEAVALDPSFVAAREELAWCLHHLERDEEALTAFKELAESGHDCARCRHGRGLVLFNMGRSGEALAELDRAHELDAGLRDAWYTRGWVLNAEDRYEDALAAYTKATDIDPGDAPAWEMAGCCLGNLGRDAESLEKFDRAIAIDPDCGDFHFSRGRALSRLGRRKEALGAIERAIELGVESPGAWYLRGWLQFELQRPAKALTAFRRYTELVPNDPCGWEMRGVCLANLGRDAAAVRAFGKLEELGHECPDCRINRALSHWSLNQPNRALREIRRATELAPKNAQAWCIRGELLGGFGPSGRLRGGPFDPRRALQAVKALGRAVRLDPGFRRAWMSRGRICSQLCHAAQASMRANAAVGVPSDEFAAIYARCFRKARESFDRVLALAADDLEALRAKAVLLVSLEHAHDVEAKAVLERIIGLAPDDAQASYDLALVELRLGDRADSARRLREALALEPSRRDEAWTDFADAIDTPELRDLLRDTGERDSNQGVP